VACSTWVMALNLPSPAQVKPLFFSSNNSPKLPGSSPVFVLNVLLLLDKQKQ